MEREIYPLRLGNWIGSRGETNRRTNKIVYSISVYSRRKRKTCVPYLDNYATSSPLVMDTNRVLRNRYRLPRFTCSSDQHILALFLRVNRYGSILNLDRIAIRGREGELLRTYLITGRNESKPVIYDFNGEAEEFDFRSHQSEGTEEAARRSPRARRRLASSSEHQIS